jgi:hypothetical protein
MFFPTIQKMLGDAMGAAKLRFFKQGLDELGKHWPIALPAAPINDVPVQYFKLR